MTINIRTEAIILDPSINFIKLGQAIHLATVPVITVTNARELTEYLQLRQSSAKMYMIEPKSPNDFIHEYAVITDVAHHMVGIFSVDDDHNYGKYMNSQTIKLGDMKYTNASTGLQGYNFDSVEYDYKSYQPQHMNASSNVTLVGLELQGWGKVKSFTQLDAHVHAHYNVASQVNSSVDVVFLLEFSNGKTYELPFKLTCADMSRFSSYGFLRSYCDTMKTCTQLFTPRIASFYMNQVQLDALEIADFKW